MLGKITRAVLFISTFLPAKFRVWQIILTQSKQAILIGAISNTCY